MIELEEVRKSFRRPISFHQLIRGNWKAERIDAVNGVSLTVAKGECIGILGNNGAGKSTLLKLIAGITSPDTGVVKVNCAGAVGYLINDERSFSWRLTAMQNLHYFAALLGVPSRQASAEITARLSQVGLSHVADMPVRQYSSGMRQRLAVARALLGNPELLLLDEPTRAIDQQGAQKMRQLFSQLIQQQQVTVFLATHEREELQQLCKRVVILHGGKVVADQLTPEDALARYAEMNPDTTTAQEAYA